MSQAFTHPYVKSRYAKEELPTWSEIWEQFALNAAYDYDPDEPGHNLPLPTSSRPEVILNSMDTYWQQPHRKLLLGWMANELNKLMIEDGRLDEINDRLVQLLKANWSQLTYLPEPTVVEIKTIIFDVIWANESEPVELYPWVFTQLSPTTGARSVFASDEPSCDMADMKGRLELATELVLRCDGRETGLKLRPTDDDRLYLLILDLILEPIRIYFDEPIGWKDEGYEPKPLTRRCHNVGIDPAL